MNDLGAGPADCADILLSLILGILREVTGLDGRSLTAISTLADIGLESLAVMNFNARIATAFPDVSKTFLYDCRTVSDVASYLQRNHPDAVSHLVASRTVTPAPAPEIPEDWPHITPIENMSPSDTGLDRSIAIIGMAGRFPGAASLQEFWCNLMAGCDSISEVPPERWSLEGFYEGQGASRDASRSYAKWGGFVANADRFDAQFFGVASREAALMDPQARLFLECAWHALEDAALLGERAASLERDAALDIGVFVGQTTNTYNLHGPDRWRHGSSEIPTCMPWSTANRLSFALNLVGPSVAIDTACSSSLVAAHMASESLIKGECKAAIVGGVNLYLHPSKYVQLCQQQMLSPTGRCRAFSADADGFVPGEGVGVLILKSLGTALRDGDRIRAVIRGSAVRHGGRTNGYTVPSPAAQAQVVSDALAAAGIAGDTISYVEAHGTGTKLGDPIEIEGLKQALGSETECTIGSVKSNIGHLEAAAGVASLIKVVLQLEHQSIAPSLHASTLNPALGLEGTGLSFARTADEWRPAKRSSVRRAGISSFGAGGANAHVIVEEAPVAPQMSEAASPLVFLLSARSLSQLKDLAAELRRLAAGPAFDTPSALAALAYTLQCGRRHFEHRLAVVASTRRGLQMTLDDYFAGKTSADVFSGRITAAIENAPAQDPTIAGPITAARSRDLAKQWVEGAAISWAPHWSAPMVPCEAPLYEFTADRHWLTPLAQERTGDAAASKSISMSVPHDASILQQHRVKGQAVFPAAAYIDLCAVEARRDGIQGAIELKNPTWQIPLVSDGTNASLAYSCRIRKSGLDRAVEIVSRALAQDVETFHFRCRVVPAASKSDTSDAALKAAEARCGQEQSLNSVYSAFAQCGIDYGPSFQCMKSARLGSNEAMVLLRQLAPVSASNDSMFDIGMLDGVLQSAALVLSTRGRPISSAFIPFSAESIRIYGALDRDCFVHVRLISESTSSKTFAFTAYGADGSVRLEIDGLAFRVIEAPPEMGAESQAARVHSLYLLEPAWVAQKASEKRPVRSLLLFDTSTALYDGLRSQMEAAPEPSTPWLALESDRFIYRNECTVEWEPRSPKHQDLLWRLLIAQGGIPSAIMFNLTGAAQRSDDWKASIGLARLSTVAEVLRALCRREGATRLHIQLLMALDDAAVQGAAGLLRSLQLEIPTISATVTVVDAAVVPQTLAHIALIEAAAAPQAGVSVVTHEASERRVRQFRFIDSAQSAPAAFQRSETFVLTGGMGSLGRVFATALASVPGMKLALLGRSEPGSKTEKVLAKLEATGARASYWPVDCASREHLAACLDQVRRRFGPITGIVHCAGVLRDAYFVRQEQTGWDEVLRTKGFAAHNIDELTRHDPLNRFVLCSSLAGTHGNVGQSAYALANGWLDGFAEARNRKVASGERRGETVSIAWPLWNTDEGMQAPATVVEWLARNGLSLLSTDDGRRVFLDALANPRPLIVPVCGQRNAIARLLGVSAVPAVEPRSTPQIANVATLTPANANDNATEAVVLSVLMEALVRVTGTPRDRIDPDSSLEVFGLDSILVAQMNAELEDHFPSLPKTALFEVRSLRGLARMLLTDHAADAARLSCPTLEVAQQRDEPVAAEPFSVAASSEAAPLMEAPAYTEPDRPTTDSGRRDGVAIIGMAGRYPGSETLDDFWRHLAAGDDLVAEVPGRWTDTSADKANGIYARWGGFVKDVDAFDPLFFGISPRDAERMDPQERLFLQTAYHAVENAGYTPESLSVPLDGAAPRRRVAVIAGVMYGEYQHYGASSGLERPEVLTNSSYASIANRVSFCLDLDGPSFAVDSMCSSSLTSIHLACQMLRAGSCEMAIAGGVNLSLHPYKYRLLSEMKFASTDGKCRSFGEGGDGYVPGEGVGAFLLKPLEAAVRDGDHIYGIIRGSDINHGGRTSGYTVPNAEAQASVIRGAFQQAGVSPERLSYIEAHGTGTSLGDPIEIRGLEKAIARDLPASRRCAIGSVKANIGHLESAAGAAALTKVLLQLKERRLAPSIHSGRLNPNIDFSKSPFVVQRDLADWPKTDGLPRLAAVSSMGAGGANAHMVVEEYEAHAVAETQGQEPELFLFSSRSRPQLEATLHRVLAHIDCHINADGTLTRERYALADVAATLRFGRQAFETRLAVVAHSFGALRATLDRFLNMADTADDFFAIDGANAFYSTTSSSPRHVVFDPLATLPAQAQGWCRGTPLPAAMPQSAFRKVPLPGYEFQQRRFWAGPPLSKSEPPAQPHSPEPKPLTPVIILERVASGLLSEREARKLLMAMR